MDVICACPILAHLAALSLFTLGFDLYYTNQWDTSFFWHKTHVLAHFVFLISEYAALGYLQACSTKNSQRTRIKGAS